MPEAQLVPLCSSRMLVVPEIKAGVCAQQVLILPHRASPPVPCPSSLKQKLPLTGLCSCGTGNPRHPADWLLLCDSHFHCRQEAK